MFYFVNEIQVMADGTSAGLLSKHDSKNDALSKYHQVLMYAAKSGLPKHSAVVFDEEGRTVAREAFVRIVPTPEPEPNEE